MHDLKIGRLELYWWVDFLNWGVGFSVRRLDPLAGVEVGLQIGPVNSGVLFANK